jgi:hypothetical protein
MLLADETGSTYFLFGFISDEIFRTETARNRPMLTPPNSVAAHIQSPIYLVLT